MAGRVLVEACVDSVDSAVSAQRAGAGRVELCADLGAGGTTPSAGSIALAGERLDIPVFVMIRPRGGDFLYSASELDVMMRDIEAARRAGADGLVFGALARDGTVDVATMRRLIAMARPLPVTMHRAFDLTRDFDEALDALMELGVERVLTSGGAARAAQGLDVIGRLVARARGRITIMPGGGIDAASAPSILEATGVTELHVGGARTVASGMTFRRSGISFARPPLADEYTIAVPDEVRLRGVIDATTSRA